VKIVFFGTPQFAANVLSYLIANRVELCAVVTRTDKPLGRSGQPVPPAVKQIARQLIPSIPILQPETSASAEFAETLAFFEAELFVVVAYGEIVKQHILDIPKSGCINLHASLLPKYRGAAPIQHAIIQGEAKTGVTIMHMVRKMDAGDIIGTAQTSIGPNERFGDIEQRLCGLGSSLLLGVIRDFERGKVARRAQDDAKATYAPKIRVQDCQINWSQSGLNIHNLVRGLAPRPSAWCYAEVKGVKRRLKIHLSRVEKEMEGKPGSILTCDSEGMVVGCGSGALRILNLQLEGKKAMSPQELLRGSQLRFL